MKFLQPPWPGFLLMTSMVLCSCNPLDQREKNAAPSSPVPDPQYVQPADSQKIQQEKAEEQRRKDEEEEQRKAEAERQQREAYAAAITTLLHEDAAIQPTAHGNDKIVVAAMRRLDLSLCPRDIAAAYLDHIHAWEDLAQIQEALRQLRSDGNLEKVFGETIIQQLTGSDQNSFKDAKGAESRLKEAYAGAKRQVLETYRVLEHLAVGYGATLAL